MNAIIPNKILGVAHTAALKDIKSAYRKLARKYHPDLNPNDKDAKKNFQQINEANEVLSDPEKRIKYDQYGQDWKHADEFEKAKRDQEQSSHSRGAEYSEPSSGGDFSDFFESMFGGSAGRSRQVQYRGEDYTSELHLDLIDAYKTHKQTMTVHGVTLRVTIPAGIENVQTIKIPGHGGLGINGGPNGDLYITISIANHPRIKRLGNDLYTTLDLDLYKAVLGGEIMMDTLFKKIKLKVKPETQNGSRIKLKNKRSPVYKNEGHYGDLYVTYSVKIPTNLTERQKVLFTELFTS